MRGSAYGRRAWSLLAKTLAQFAACAVACLALTAPLFYLLTKYYYAEDLIEVVEAVGRGQGVPDIDLEQDIVEGMMLQFLLVFATLSVSFFITVRFATKRLWRPFDDSLRKAEEFNLAQGDIPSFGPTGVREFDRLNRSLESLMANDREAFRVQKEFTENASHELQTPLAVVRSKLDLLMLQDLSASQMGIVSDLYELTVRMSHLNRNLLLLAKIDNASPSALEAVDVVEVFSRSLPLYETVSADAKVRLADRRSCPSARVRANAFLLECLLKNLVVNAIRHSASGAEVLVEVADSGVVVSNASADGLPLDGASLFRRFRAGDVRSKGNGLGLAIVKAICDFHGWRVEYRFVGGRHVFVVSFPGVLA
ncbi:MAG: sensor histidine kinase [Marinilabiliaceae bacterium]